MWKHRAVEENADPVKRLPLRFVDGHRKARCTGKLPPREDERKLALGRSDFSPWHECSLVRVWPCRDFDVKDPLQSGDEHAADTVEQSRRWVYRAQQHERRADIENHAMGGHPGRCHRLQKLSRVYDAAVHVRGAVDAEGLEFLGRNTPHNVFVDMLPIVVLRREHGSPGEGKPGFVVTFGPEGVQVGEDGVDEVARVLAGDDEVVRNSHLSSGEGVDGTPQIVLLSAVTNSHLPRTELPLAEVIHSRTQRLHVGRQLQQSHPSP